MRYLRNNNFEITNYGNTALLVKRNDNEGFYALNDTGKFLLELLAVPKSFDEMLSALVDTYTVSPTEAADDLKNFLPMMEELHVIARRE